MAKRVPIALTIAGSDPSGGAGIQADIKTFAAHGVYGASVLTALTAQNTIGVTGVFGVPADFIRQQFDAVMSDLDVGAIKTGMLADAATVALIGELLAGRPATPVVVDPVMVATSGDVLLAPEAVQTVRDVLAPLARVLTPNLPEAATLLKCSVATSEDEAVDQGRALLALGSIAVLVKGGHGGGASAVDHLITAGDVIRFENPRIETRNTHGTGCTLSAAIAAGLASGLAIEAAVASANAYVHQALVAGSKRSIGQGRGPVDHEFATRRLKP